MVVSKRDSWSKLVIFGTPSVYLGSEEQMLEKKYIRDGKNRVIGSITTGFEGSFETLVRDEHENIIGRTSERFGTTRDEHGNLVSIDTADPGLLFNRKK